jgi:ParB family transcriptional regulator, chromosome partitioning protein
MKIATDLIKVEDDIRIRKEIGNLQPLIDSISKVGLINPILIDEQSNLVAGFRRLEACKKLKMEEVEVRIVEFGGDLMKMLDVEVAENFFRKDFTPEEVLATERRRQEIFEATRKKGLFERFWLWLKSLFVSSPAPSKKTPSVAQPSAEQAKTQDGNLKEKGSDPPFDTPSEKTERHSVSEQDDRSIKWRTS